MKKSIFGLNENCAASIACLFTFVSGLAALVLERENKFVRFHAMQTTLFGLAALILWFAIGIIAHIPIIGWIIGWLAALVSSILCFVWFVVTVYLAVMAYKGQTFKLPIIGDISWDQVNK